MTTYDDVNAEAHADWAANRPDAHDPGNQEPAGAPTSLGPDPWEPFVCQSCGHEEPTGMPRTCLRCGLRNWGK